MVDDMIYGLLYKPMEHYVTIRNPRFPSQVPIEICKSNKKDT